MREVLVIRFSSLGDLCILGASLARWSALPGADGRRVTLVTKAAFAPLLRRMRGVDEVLELEGSAPADLDRLVATVGRRRWDAVIDAHGTLRSALLLARAGLRPDARLAKDTVARLALLRWRIGSRALGRSMSDRFDELLGAAGLGPVESGRVEPGPALRTGVVPQEPRLGLAPGAQWASKQWPEENFAAVLSGFRNASDAPVSVFLGPREQGWYGGSRLEQTIARTPDVEVVQGRSLVEAAEELARCGRLLTNDSGLLHVAEAVQTPVLALFGPTVREWGFFPRLPDSSVFETSIECRPCSRNGKRECPRGDLACLRRIEPDRVLARLLDSFAWPASGARP